MRGDRNSKIKHNKKKIVSFLSSFKISWQVKLMAIVLLFSFGLVSFTCFFQIDKTINNKELLAVNEAVNDAANEYYERLDEVYNEYNDEEKEFSKLVITSAFTIMQLNIMDFSFEDMTKGRMREVADLMLDEAKKEDGRITYTEKSEEEVKESLAAYFKDYSSSLDDVTCQRMANDVYEYIEAYLELTEQSEGDSGSSASCNGNSYWWPIGSAEVTTENGVNFASGTPVISNITATFAGNDTVHNGNHGAIDISNGNGVGGTNIIAAQDGVVIYPTEDSQTQFEDNGYIDNPDGDGLGNYVVIEHSDGNYTYYGHLAKGSITVRAGDNVKRGQVIATMGNSGSSTGVHLHFEIRTGGTTQTNRVDPLEYVSIEDPRPNCADFSLTTTSLSKQEFVSKMEAYCTSSGNTNFCNEFAAHAEEVYDVSISANVNPELVVVTAGTEMGWKKCGGYYNFWGIGIPNGAGCSDGPHLTSLADGIRRYAETISKHLPGGDKAAEIEKLYKDREEAGCDPAGHGLPGTLAGMQSNYSWIGDYRYSPGSWGRGGCIYLDIIYGEGYCAARSVCTDYSNCPESSATTVCEQNDYTAYQLQEKTQLRKSIFGL